MQPIHIDSLTDAYNKLHLTYKELIQNGYYYEHNSCILATFNL